MNLTRQLNYISTFKAGQTLNVMLGFFKHYSG